MSKQSRCVGDEHAQTVLVRHRFLEGLEEEVGDCLDELLETIQQGVTLVLGFHLDLREYITLEAFIRQAPSQQLMHVRCCCLVLRTGS